MMLHIKFGKSTSKNYSQALRLLKKFSNSQDVDEGSPINSIIVEESDLVSKFWLIEELYQIIQGWTTTKVLLDDVGIQPWSFFNKMRLIVKCSDLHNRAISKDNYCNIDNTHEGWGCRYISETIRHLNSGSYYSNIEHYWYKFGFFKNDQTWTIDKIKIKEKLETEIQDKGISLCPHFDKSKCDKILNELPPEIDLTNEFWEIIYKEDFFGSIIQRKPESIKHITKDSENSHKGLFFGSPTFDNDQNSLGQSKHYNNLNRNIPNVSFRDIGGIDDIIEIIREVIELPLIKPELFQHLGIKPHKGVLLYGEPGNGKTMIAQAIANEINAHFISIAGPELISKWHGESEERLREKFIEARNNQPSIIFFDEIDSIAQKRTDSDSGRLDSKFVNQLLTLMDGIETYGNVSVLASTNRPELLDDALLRPGRFDYKIEIKRPTTIGCKEIFEILTKEMPLAEDVDTDMFSLKLLGLSGAEIAFVVNEAAYNCMRRNLNLKKFIALRSDEHIDLNKLFITLKDFVEALNKTKE